jgi:hypothetical protein
MLKNDVPDLLFLLLLHRTSAIGAKPPDSQNRYSAFRKPLGCSGIIARLVS